MAHLRLIERSYPDDPELGTAVSRAILLRVAAGELGPTVRVHLPGRELAFGRQDVAAPGYERAREAARAAAYPPVERLAGGRAAVFHEGTVAITRAYPDRDPPRRTYERFGEAARWVELALARLGVGDVRVGEVPGEYCPGAYSLNARGRSKLAGIGQRMIRNGAHVGGVVVASGAEELRRVLVPVYDALGLDWDPATAGAVDDELGRELRREELAAALVEAIAAEHELERVALDDETLALAERLKGEGTRVIGSLSRSRRG
ncbi:MAG: lipoate--protein ligase family protein [Solirubrobacterales bacterium]